MNTMRILLHNLRYLPEMKIESVKSTGTPAGTGLQKFTKSATDVATAN